MTPGKTRLANEIGNELLEYHRRSGYEIHDSYAVLSPDPTVLFTNASMTPFKYLYAQDLPRKPNYAIIQRCFRMGGASDLELIGRNPYFHTMFDMFGSGTFGIDHARAVQYLLELMTWFGLEQNQLYFTVPADTGFKNAILAAGVDPAMVFELSHNGHFWCDWKFGENGPIGNGLTLVYSRHGSSVQTVEQLFQDSDEFVELLNLIYIHSRSQSGQLIKCQNPGFDLGMGMERFVAVIQGVNNYQIDSMQSLIETVRKSLETTGCHAEEPLLRLLVDHLRAAIFLIDEGLTPSNKKSGYVLRKLIRRILEQVWLNTGTTINLDAVIESLCLAIFDQQSNTCPLTQGIFRAEASSLLQALNKARRLLDKAPYTNPQFLKDTLGVSIKLLTLISGGSK